jgi:hypothetical protein
MPASLSAFRTELPPSTLQDLDVEKKTVHGTKMINRRTGAQQGTSNAPPFWAHLFERLR